MKIDILCDGQVLRQINHRNRRYLVAPPSGTYTIRLVNDHDLRQLAVVSVDGVNVVNNQEASTQGRGYVLRPGETLIIPGWRRDDNEVAAFQFGAKSDSYTSQTGRGDKNNGAIGLAVFNEALIVGCAATERIKRTRATRSTSWSINDVLRGHESTLGPSHKSFDLNNLPTAAHKGSDLGTGYGARVDFRTQSTPFRAQTEHPIQVVELLYATRDRLVELGVPVRQEEEMPSAFPADQIACPAPPGWNG